MSSVFFAAAIPFFANLILARQLPQDQYALFSLLYAFIGTAGAIALAGQPTAFTAVFFSCERRGFAVRGVIKQAVWVITCGLFLAAIIWWIFWRFKLQSVIDFRLFGLVFALIAAKALFDFFNTVVNCLDLYKAYAVAAAFSGGLMFGVLALKPSVVTYFIIGIVAYSSAALFLHNRVRRVLDNDHQPDFSVTAKLLFKAGWVAVPGMLVTSGLTFGERSLISRFLDNKDLAVYAVATTIAVSGARVLVTAILKPTLISLLGALQEDDSDKVGQLIKSMNILLLLALTAFVFITTWLGEKVFIGFFGEQYASALHLLIPLFSISVLDGFGVIMSQPVIQKGKLGILVFVGITATGFNFLSNFLLIPQSGLNALVISYAASTFFSVLAIFGVAKLLGSKIFFPFFSIGYIILLNIFHQVYL